MKYSILIFLVSLMLTLLASQCNYKDTEDCHKSITIANNSDYELYMTISSTYPDSLCSICFGSNDPSSNPPTPPHTMSKYYVLRPGNCLERRIGLTNEQGIWMFFLFDNQVIQTVPWDTIVKYRMYLRKYDMTVDDLRNSNWTITYP